MVTLEPMSETEWVAWRANSIRNFAREMVRVDSWPEDGAETRAAAEHASLVPDGMRTPGHEFRSIVNEAGHRVGSIWFAGESDVGRGAAFIWDIVIDESERGSGYGRAAMLALEPIVRALGYDSIRLHVFGDNVVARHLYRAVGYDETDVSMTKHLDRTTDRPE